MKQFIFILIFCLTGCAIRQESIDFQQVLDAAESRANQAKSLGEDTLLVQALDYYQTLEPKDSARLSQATILTAYHYWWKGEKPKAYELLESIADTDKEALESLMDLGSRDNDFEACYGYLKRMMKDDTENLISIYRGSLSEDNIALMGKILLAIRKERGVTVEEVSASTDIDYNRANQLIGMLETDGLITRDLLQRCFINFSR